MTRNLLVAIAFVVLACNAKADAPPPQAQVSPEWVGSVPSNDIYRFKDGSVTCYVARRPAEAPAISCVTEAK
jgi:hypothetical protein